MNLPDSLGNSAIPTSTDRGGRPGLPSWKYPDHPKYQRWVLNEAQAADVRINVPRKR